MCLVLCNSAAFLNCSSVTVLLGGELGRGMVIKSLLWWEHVYSRASVSSQARLGEVLVYLIKNLLSGTLRLYGDLHGGDSIFWGVWCPTISWLCLPILADKFSNLTIKDDLCTGSVSQIIKLASTFQYSTLACFGFSFNRFHLFSVAFLRALPAPA